MTGQAAPGPRIPTTRKALFAVAITAFTLGALELAARLAPAAWTMDRDQAVRTAITRDALIASQNVPGWDLDPGGGSMGGLPYTTNRWNMRGPDYDAVPPPGSVRVIFVGDSSIFGFGLEWDETFSAVFERLREKRQPDVDYQVANCTCPGHSTVQSLYKLERQCLAFQPDLVVIGNLNSDSTMAMVEDSDRFHLVRGAPGTGLLERSLFYRTLRNGWIRTRYEDIDLPEEIPQHGQPQQGTLRRVPLALYRTNLVALGQMVRDAGSVPAFLLLPNRADATQADKEIPVEYRQAMREVAAELQAPLVDGPSRFADLGDVPRLFQDSVHPGPLGAGILGDMLDKGLPVPEPRPR